MSGTQPTSKRTFTAASSTDVDNNTNTTSEKVEVEIPPPAKKSKLGSDCAEEKEKETAVDNVSCRVTHFSLNANNVDRCIEFFSSTFDWKFVQLGNKEIWMINTGDGKTGIDGRLEQRKISNVGIMMSGSEMDHSFKIYISVSNADAYKEKVVQNGGHIEGEKQSAVGAGYWYNCRDPDMNRFQIFETNEKAVVLESKNDMW